MDTVDEMRAAVDATSAVLEAMGADVKSRGFPGAMVDALKELGGNRPVREGDAGRRGRGLFATRRMRRGRASSACENTCGEWPLQALFIQTVCPRFGLV